LWVGAMVVGPARSVGLSAALVFACATLRARAAVDFRDLAEMVALSEVALDPDGRRIVFTGTQADFEANEQRTRIWYFDPGGPRIRERIGSLLGVGGEVEPPDARPLTSAGEDASSPRFTPDGRAVSFLSARGESAAVQVWVLPLDGGEAEARTDAPEGVDQYAWAPDGSLVYLAQEPHVPGIAAQRDARAAAGFDEQVVDETRRDWSFWRIGPEGGEARRVHRADPGVTEFALSFDGKRIAFASNGTGHPKDWKKADLWAVDVDSGRLTRLTERLGDDWSPRWSGDGSRVFFLSCIDTTRSYSQIAVWSIPSAGGEITLGSDALDRDVIELVTCEDSDRIYLTVADGTNEQLWRLVGASRRAERLSAEPGRASGLAVKRNGELAAFVYESPTAGPEIATWTFPDERIEVRTRTNAALTAKVDAVRRIVRWAAPDGLDVEGVLVLPPDWEARRPLPAVVVGHGGPADHAVNTLADEQLEAIAARGYAALAPNFRGSTGYGAAFNVANFRDLGGADFADVMAGVDWLVDQGIADPARLGITGASYGGFLTNRAVVGTSRFAAGVSRSGIASFVTDFANSELSEFEWDYFHAYFWEDFDAYWSLSPLSRVSEAKTPLLLLHGEDDTNTAPANSRELYSSLRARGVPAELVTYPREGHAFEEPTHWLDARERMMAWFDRWLVTPGAEIPARAGDPVRDGPWTLVVTSARWQAGIGAVQPDAGLLVVDLVLSAEEPVDGRIVTLCGEGAEIALVDAAGRRFPPLGIPVEWPGGEHLVTGRQTVELRGSPESGDASWTFRAAFDPAALPASGRLAAFGMPPVSLTWATRTEEQE
ncbi:MAG: prolyl oligopeptidase family serine peptidase, partial [Candidatus Eiseniibacteriota bacterium]